MHPHIPPATQNSQEATRLEAIFRAAGRDMIIDTDAWMPVDKTARTVADNSYVMACWLMFVGPC